MTPEEKAIYLVKEMYYGFQHTIDKYTAKSCALKTVDEIIYTLGFIDDKIFFKKALCYWEKVKEEIEKL